MAQAREKLTRNSTNIVRLDHLRDVENNVYPDSAAVVFTLKTTLGVDVVGAIGINMAYVAGDASVPPGAYYRGVIPFNVALPNASYVGIITATYLGVQRQFVVNYDVVDG
jgi:hypothetical protein